MYRLFPRHIFEKIRLGGIVSTDRAIPTESCSGAFIVGRIVVVPDVVAGFRVVIQGAGMRIVVGAERRLTLVNRLSIPRKASER